MTDHVTMQALCLAGDGQVALRSVPRPRPLVGEALIRVLRVGVCNTDHEMAKGYGQGQQNVKEMRDRQPIQAYGHKTRLRALQDMIIGHEFVGIIEDINSNVEQVNENSHTSTEVTTKPRVGDRVVGEINLSCEECDVCKKGGIPKRNHCPNRTVLGIINKNGTFAEYVTLPVCNLYPVPDDVTDKEAAFAEPLAAAFRIIEQVDFSEADKVAIIGDGKLGLLISEVLALKDVKKVTLFGRHMDKMALAPDSIEKQLSAEDSMEKYENSFDVCIDACGVQSGVKMAVKVTRPLGVIILKTTCADDNFVFNPFEVVVKEQTIIGSRCGNFKMALEALSNDKKINVDRLVSSVYPMSQGVEAFKMAAVKGSLKVQIIMGE